jgi:hypothetical protein
MVLVEEYATLCLEILLHAGVVVKVIWIEVENPCDKEASGIHPLKLETAEFYNPNRRGFWEKDTLNERSSEITPHKNIPSGFSKDLPDEGDSGALATGTGNPHKREGNIPKSKLDLADDWNPPLLKATNHRMTRVDTRTHHTFLHQGEDALDFLKGDGSYQRASGKPQRPSLPD